MGSSEAIETAGAFALMVFVLIIWCVLLAVQTIAVSAAVVFVTVARLTRFAAETLREP